ncbi:UNVERIFIED_CONTAM: putative mitochondrial protein [Sesamum radiatum]|uniref:Mitochondrial protein n=1 Tax=Sesamum radiatum TaxID=300843 RepID=A0AAW2T3I3_SESRA
MRDFWWHNRGEKRVHWVAWKKVCRPLGKGGLGVRELKAFNIVLLAKQGWRLITKPNSLLSLVLKAKYFPHCSFWDAQVGGRPSLTWRSILLAKEVLRKGCEERSVADAPGEIRQIWKPSKKGIFSVRSAYEVFLGLADQQLASTSRPFPMLTEDCEHFWRHLWVIVAPPRVRLQIWRFCYDAVPTMANLAKRQKEVDTHCHMCEAEVETLQHILLECPFARMAWGLSNLPWCHVRDWREGAAAWFSAVMKRLDKEEGAWFITLCWALWQNRNRRRMEGSVSDPQRVVRQAQLFLRNYVDARNKLKLGLLK